MTALLEKLDSLGLSQYASALKDNGFDDWDTVLDITEEDLSQLGFKLGHRRILQREIASARGVSPQESGSPTATSFSNIASPTTEPPGIPANEPTSETKRTKRRYRWHPRPDPNAPKRPKTAYVNFADHLRTDPAIANMSFVEIAREVGRQWQLMDPSEKQRWESQAAAAMQEHEEHMEIYRRTDAYQEYQQYLESFKRAPGKSSRQKLRAKPQQQRETNRAHRSASADSTASKTNSVVSGGEHTGFSLQSDCQQALTRAMGELKRLKQEYSGEQPFDLQDFLSEAAARLAVTAFVDGSGSLLYVFSREQADRLLERIYKQNTPPHDMLLLSELCVAAAVGGYFDTKQVPLAVTRKLVFSAFVFLEDVIVSEESYLRIMRIFLCLAMYSLLEKHLSARYFVAAALSIARWKFPFLPIDGDAEGSRDSWRKVYRTLVFMECWLCYTLGYSSEHIAAHVQYALECECPRDSIENAIQYQAAKMVVVAADISQTLSDSEQMTGPTMDSLIHKLDAWHCGLPEGLQLSSLLSNVGFELNIYQERAILMVHLLYLGAVILLYRRLLVLGDEAARSGRWFLDIDQSDFSKYQSRCETAAQQVARVVGLLKFNGACTLRCWLIIYWSFSACTVLLYRTAQNVRDLSLATVDDDLAHSKTCLNMLRACNVEEPIAGKYMEMLAPSLEALQGIRAKIECNPQAARSFPQPKISISSLLQPTPATTPSPSNCPAYSPTSDGAQTPERRPSVDPALLDKAASIVQRLSTPLKDPFGRLLQCGREGSMSPYTCPYPTPPLSETQYWFR